MIEEKIADLLTVDAEIIAHQVNCAGVMGAGVAKLIKQRLAPGEFDKYRNECYLYGLGNLGSIQFLKQKDGPVIANLFAEDIPTGKGLDTDYDSLRGCLITLRDTMLKKGYSSVAFPGLLGCGLAGGNWDIVRAMIYQTFAKTDINVSICYIDADVYTHYNS